jgi:hypothetical protein
MDIDLNNLSLVQIVITLFAITLLDWISGVGVAIANKTFTFDRVAEFLTTHVVRRVIPLSFAAALGLGVPQLGLQPILAIWGIFLLGAAAYVAETLASIAKNLGSATLPDLSTSGSGDDTEDVPSG